MQQIPLGKILLVKTEQNNTPEFPSGDFYAKRRILNEQRFDGGQTE